MPGCRDHILWEIVYRNETCWKRFRVICVELAVETTMCDQTLMARPNEPYQVAVGRIGRRGLVRLCDLRVGSYVYCTRYMTFIVRGRF